METQPLEPEMSDRLPPFATRSIGPLALSALRVVSFCLWVAMGSVVIYTCVTDGSPFRMVLLTPWMAATLIDFYFNVALLSVLVCLKEKVRGLRLCGKFYEQACKKAPTARPPLQSAVVATLWVLLLICFGSATTWLYVWLVALRARPGDSIAKLLLG